MGGKTIAYVWLCAWAVVFALSFFVTANTGAKDFGFTRGLNRVTTFVGWQFAATILALVVWSYVRQFDSGSWRWLFRIPMILAGTLTLIIAFLCLRAIVFKPQPSDSPKPTPPVTAIPSRQIDD